jgi:hypothetical protein
MLLPYLSLPIILIYMVMSVMEEESGAGVFGVSVTPGSNGDDAKVSLYCGLDGSGFL